MTTIAAVSAFGSLDSVRGAGFEELLPVRALRESRLAEVPKLPGVYLILRELGAPVRFLYRYALKLLSFSPPRSATVK